MLAKGTYLLQGPGKLTVEKGSVEVLGYRIDGEGQVVVPVGRSVPALVEEGARASYTGKTTGLSSEAYQKWHDTIQGLGELDSRILLVGPSDTGKSTLAAWIINKIMQERGRSPLFATVDIGQNENFCPGFTSSVVVRDPPFIPGGGGDVYSTCFVGSFTPTNSLSRYIYCAHSMLKGWQGPLVMDSDGWVTVWDGIDSKIAVAEAVGFDKVVLVGLGEREEEYIRGKLRGVEIVRLGSLVDSRKSREERRIHRERLIAKALAGARERGFKVDSVPVYGGPIFLGQRVDPRLVGEALGLHVYYAERVGGELRVVARVRGRRIQGATLVRPGWERGLLSAVVGGGVVRPGIVTRVNYRTGTLYVYTPYEGDPEYIELGVARLDPEAFMGKAKW
ncbi:MAG: hypothetical protein GXO68_02495 [Crenarchaeota archaeon]|nr:hypothetical protein [Thermoproteota archaeon]